MLGHKSIKNATKNFIQRNINLAENYYFYEMRIGLVLVLLFLTSNLYASEFTIPRKLRGRYTCEVPGYEIVHQGKVTKVEALTAILLVYKTKIILRIDDRSFPSNVEKQVVSRRNPVYTVEFSLPFQPCEITFDRRKKTVLIDLPIFQGLSFVKSR
jgi:hypothetical protein